MERPQVFLRYKPNKGEIPNDVAARNGMVENYQYSMWQKRRMIKHQLQSITMSEGQDPDTFINELCQSKDELVEKGEVINEAILLVIILEGVPDKIHSDQV